MSKFDKHLVEDDTELLLSEEVMLGALDALYQRWRWDGISAESLVFWGDDVHDMEDGEIEEEVRQSPVVEIGSEITVNRTGDGYVVVSFNFSHDD